MADPHPQGRAAAHRRPARVAAGRSAAVIGLGRFGTAVAIGLEQAGVQVLGIDSSAQIVSELEDELTFVARADSTDSEALLQLAIPDFDQVIVGIGANLEGSILTASHLVDLGVQNLWVKANSDDHARILRQIGVANVIQPEAELGARLAVEIAATMSEG